MIIAVAAIFALALLSPLLHRLFGQRTGWVLALLPLALTMYFASQLPLIADGNVQRTAYAWVPGLGVELAFRLDGLSMLFALLICGIGALVFVYAGGYLKGERRLGLFYAYLSLFMAAMLGLVLADNLLVLFVFWELTSVSSYLLIGFTSEREESRAAANQALLITGGGGLALLGGLILLGQVGGTYELGALLGLREVVQASPLYGPILTLILLGAFTKSAQFPFHFWLPGAMEAPTPVSAYLHSATMVKAGVYLLARLLPVLGGTPAWHISVIGVGAATMLVGGLLALYQTDLKRVLAYSTVSALGTLVLLLGIGSEQAVIGAIVFLLAHALYKGALFMIAGAVDHETGTRNLERLSGLRRAMPITAAVAGLAAVSLAGFGPVLSFIGKELLLEAALEVEGYGPLLAALVVLAGGLFVLVALLVGVRPFYGTARPTPKPAHEAPLSMWLGPALLALAGLLFGLLPAVVENTVVAGAVGAVLQENIDVHIYLWHGFNLSLLLSIVSVVVGAGLYLLWARLRHATPLVERVLGWWPSRGFTLMLDGINRLARVQTRFWQNGYLRYYLLMTLFVTVGLVGATMVTKGGLPTGLKLSPVSFYEIALAAMMLGAAAAAVRSPGRLSTVVALGIVGYGVALFYIIYGAPDLAMTQILVETLTVILFVLVFYHLPRFGHYSRRASRARDAVVALLAGGLMSALVLAATATPTNSRLAPFFIANSKPLAHGSNIVNVILVDFRGIDTMGEITVLAIAAIGVVALLRLGRARPKVYEIEEPTIQPEVRP